MNTENPRACMILIGDELLSGRTQDKNLPWLSTRLNDMGVRVVRCHIIADVEEEIIATVNEARARYDYVFTTGGIGPTHDDITTQAIGRAFGVDVVRHKEAYGRLQRHYGDERLNEARAKMADIPVGAELIDNPLSAAPGFRLENVFVLAGVPSVMQAMFDHFRHMLTGGAVMLSWEVSLWAREGDISATLRDVAERHTHASIGCYPIFHEGRLGASIVVRSTQQEVIDTVRSELLPLINAHEMLDHSGFA